jgi:tetratricopeptide (TPR) repeat protein
MAAPYEARLREIVDEASRAGATVVLSTPASNLRDVPPLRPAHREGLEGPEREAWAASYREGRALAKAGRHQEALAASAKAEAIDGSHAGLLYDQARSHYALGRYQAAKRLFVAARDQDYNPMRATTPIGDAVRRVAAAHRVPLADAEAAFAELSPHGLPGDELFFDKVHLNPRGAMALAECWARALEAHGLLGPQAGWDWSRARRREDYERALGIDAKFLAKAHAEMGFQLSLSEAGGRDVEAFRRPQFLEATRERGSRHFAEALRLDRQAADGFLAEFKPYAHCYIAEAFLSLGEAGRAAAICEGVLNVLPRFALACEVGIRAYTAAGSPEKAEQLRRFRAALERWAEGGDGAPTAQGLKELER